MINTENEIRKIQQDIIRIKKEKNMRPNMEIISSILNDEAWYQDKIEKIREDK